MLVVVFFTSAMLFIQTSGFDIDFKDEIGPFIPISTEQAKPFMGRARAECEGYKYRCKMFSKCFGNCNEQLIYASELNSAGESLSEEQRKEAEHIKTNPCVGMFAYCLSVDFFTLRSVLKLRSPDAF